MNLFNSRDDAHASGSVPCENIDAFPTSQRALNGAVGDPDRPIQLRRKPLPATSTNYSSTHHANLLGDI